MPKLPQKMLPLRNASVDYQLDYRGEIEGFELQTSSGVIRATSLEGLELAFLILEAYTQNQLNIGGNNYLRLESILDKL